MDKNSSSPDSSREITPPEYESSRRQLLRRIGIGAAVTGTISLAGCSGVLESSQEVSNEMNVGPADSGMSRQEFAEFVENAEKMYGNAGVWGNSRTEPAHDLEYVGAWKSSKSVKKGDATEGVATLDSAVALYQIPGKVSEDNQQHYQFWLWSAARPVEGASDDEILPFTQLESGVSFDDSAYTMLAYSPSHDSSEGPVSVGPQSPDVKDLAASFPLRQGNVRYNPDSKVGASGEYGVQWNGEVTRVQSVNATFEASWPSGDKHQFTWESRLETTKAKF